MRHIFKPLMLLALVLLHTERTGAQTDVTIDGSGSAYSAARMVRDPGASALAGAGFAAGDNPAWAAFRNAAAVPLSGIQRLDAALCYQSWMPEIDPGTNLQGGLALRFDRLGLSLGFARQGYGAYDVYNAAGSRTGSFSPSDLQLSLGMGSMVGDHLSMGVQLSLLSTSLDASTTYSALSLGLSALWQKDALSLAAGVSHLGLSLSPEAGDDFRPPLSLDLGSCYTLPLGERHSLQGRLDGSVYENGGLSACAGLDLALWQLLDLRAGYRLSDTKAILPSHAAAGLGIRFKGIRLEGSWLFASDILKNSWSVGLAYGF